jgi:predicted dehydrogenase
VFDLLVHDFDLLNWYLGRPNRVVARGRRHVQGGYDYIAAIFSYPGGATAVAEGGFVFRPPAGLRSTLRVVCERGHIEVNTNDPATPIRVFEEGKPEQGISVKLDNLLIDGLVAEFTEFLDTIDGNVHGRLRVEDARHAVACAAAVIRAADTGREIEIG